MSMLSSSASILNCVLLDQKHIYEAYKQVLSTKTQNSISLWMWASSEANAALRDIVMRFAEFEILVVKLLQGYMKKFVEHRRVLKQVVEEEQNVADVRNQHADFSKKAAKLSSKFDHHAKKKDKTKLKNLENELQIAKSHEEEKKEQLEAAVLRLEVLKASLVRNSLVMISDAGVRLAQGLEKISINQHKISKMIPVIPAHLATPSPSNPNNTSCYPGTDVTSQLVDNVAQDIGIMRSTPQECSHLCEPMFKRPLFPPNVTAQPGANSLYTNTTSSALVNHPLTKLNLPPPPYSPPSPVSISGDSPSQTSLSSQYTPGVHTCRRMNRTRSSNNSITRERKERSHFKYGNRASVANDGYDEINDSNVPCSDRNDSDFDDDFENIELDALRDRHSETDTGGAASATSAASAPFSTEDHVFTAPLSMNGVSSNNTNVSVSSWDQEHEQYSHPLRWDPSNLLKDAASTNKMFAKVYNQINGQKSHGDVPTCTQQPYLNLVTNFNPDCSQCKETDGNCNLLRKTRDPSAFDGENLSENVETKEAPYDINNHTDLITTVQRRQGTASAHFRKLELICDQNGQFRKRDSASSGLNKQVNSSKDDAQDELSVPKEFLFEADEEQITKFGESEAGNGVLQVERPTGLDLSSKSAGVRSPDLNAKPPIDSCVSERPSQPKQRLHEKFLLRSNNRFGVRKALFRLRASRLSTSEPNLSKKT